ncbi:MAG TPA: TonB-dependent receptor [Pedomonas sp.]|uniref:TonB-dependent receptor n=1 Tax=Pedomonas sp. TaxID=2976421 RepID=UPI002F3FA83B
MKRIVKHAALCCAAALPATMLPPVISSACAAQGTAATAGLEEIIVTARRTAESLQDTPVAVTALSSAALEQRNVQDVSAIPQLVPNLSLFQQAASPTAASVFIRGVGNSEPSSVTEQGVGIYLDGVFIARSGGAIFDLVDLERIEVLRGPQGTLFGRNTIGGAIQLISKKPADEPGLEAKAGYASFSEWYVRGRIDTGHIADTPIKASLVYQHRQRDGYVDNLLRPGSRDPGAINGDAVSFSLRGDFDTLTIDYTFDYNDRRNVPPYFQTIAATQDVIDYFSKSPLFGGDPFVVGPNRRGEGRQIGFVDQKGRDRVDSRAKVRGHALAAELAASDSHTLKSISAYRKFNQSTIMNLSGQGNLLGVVLDPVTFEPAGIAPVNLFNGNGEEKQWQFSQELQALGQFDEWNYVLGAYYFYEKASEFNPQPLTVALPGGQVGLNLSPISAFGGTARSIAAFGQASFRPAALEDRLELTGGLRHTWDRKTIFLAGDRTGTGEADFTNLSWLASASYDLAEDAMAYARVSTGYRSGGFSPRSETIMPFQPEKVTAYEAGLKAEFWQRRVRANVAVFHTDFRNQQISQFAAGSGGASSEVVNAGKVALRGLEAEIAATPIRGLTFNGSVGVVDPDYKTYLYRDPLTNELINIADEVRPPSTSKFNAHAGAEYSEMTALGHLSVRIDYAYRSTVYWFAIDRTTPFNRDIRSRPDHNLFARIALSEIDLGHGRLEVAAWGDNLTNQKNIDFGIDFGELGFAGASYKKPRSFGLDVKITY